MFIGRKEAFEKEVLKIVKDNFDGDRVCEVCGCLIKTTEAVKGVSVIKKKVKSWVYYDYSKPIQEQLLDESMLVEYVYTPYYCKVHAPKKEEKAEKQQPLIQNEKSSIDKRNIHTYKEKVGGKTFVGAFEVKDYSQDFPSCSCTSMEPWERPECRYCIHYDASDFERWKEEKVKEVDYVEPYGVSCRNIERALKEEREV